MLPSGRDGIAHRHGAVGPPAARSRIAGGKKHLPISGAREAVNGEVVPFEGRYRRRRRRPVCTRVVGSTTRSPAIRPSCGLQVPLQVPEGAFKEEGAGSWVSLARSDGVEPTGVLQCRHFIVKGFASSSRSTKSVTPGHRKLAIQIIDTRRTTPSHAGDRGLEQALWKEMNGAHHDRQAEGARDAQGPSSRTKAAPGCCVPPARRWCRSSRLHFHSMAFTSRPRFPFT